MADLKAWTYLQDMTVPGCSECPDFFPMSEDGGRHDQKWVWTAANGVYLVGNFDGRRFFPETEPRQADQGGNYYAIQTYSDISESDGRRIQIAWMRGGKYPDMPFNQQMSFPCELRLRRFAEGLRLCRTPVREIERLHDKERAWKAFDLKPGVNPLSECSGILFDISEEIELGTVAEIGFRIRGEPIRYSVKEKTLTCLGQSASLKPVDGRLKFQLLVDRASLEVFGNDGEVSMTSCFLPDPENRNLELYEAGGVAKIISLKICELRSIWSTP